MTRIAEISAFTLLALGLHLGVWVSWPGAPGGGAGDNGQNSMTLAAASPQLSEMVRQWQRPPDLSHDIAQPPPPHVAAQPAPKLTRLTPAPVSPAPDLPPPPPNQTELPQISLPAPAPTLVAQAPRLPLVQPMPDGATHIEAALDQIPDPNAPARLIAQTRTTPPKIDVTPPIPRLRPKARPQPQAAQPRTRAAGTGAAQTAGSVRKPTPPATGQAQSRRLLASWGAQIKSRIERQKRYPSGTSATGTARLRVSVARNGALAGVSLRKSSGNRQLDRAAIRAVQRAGRFPAAPNGLTKSRYSFTLALSFAG